MYRSWLRSSVKFFAVDALCKSDLRVSSRSFVVLRGLLSYHVFVGVVDDEALAAE